MARFDVILQGGGKIVLAIPEGALRKDEAGQMMHDLQSHIDSGRPITMINGVGDIIDNRPLNERNVTPILTRDRSSGKYHERYVVVQTDGGERMVTDERCQADQSGKFDVVDELPEAADRNVLCYYCFPPVEKTDEYTAGPV